MNVGAWGLIKNYYIKETNTFFGLTKIKTTSGLGLSVADVVEAALDAGVSTLNYFILQLKKVMSLKKKAKWKTADTQNMYSISWLHWDVNFLD